MTEVMDFVGVWEEDVLPPHSVSLHQGADLFPELAFCLLTVTQALWRKQGWEEEPRVLSFD